jgi:DHA2 family multidrug resistance protein-like MFS transporter
MSIIVQALLASRHETRWVAYMMGTGHEPFRPEQDLAKEQDDLWKSPREISRWICSIWRVLEGRSMSTATHTAKPASERDPGRWMALYSVIVAALAVTLDGAIMGLIAPAVAEDLGANAATIGLISSMSMLMLAAFILGGGTLGDIYGRKRFLAYGLVGSTITSVLVMVTPSAALLIPVRALAGIMAALVNPLALAIIMVTFDKEERPKALGLYGAAIGVVGGLGTIVIAFLNQQFGWRATFGLIALFAVVGFIMVRRFVQESKAGGSKRVDWVGIMLTAGGLFGIVYGINQAAAQGFGSPAVWVPVGIGVVLLVVLVLYSKRTQDPALQLRLFQNRIFSVGVLLFMVIGFASMGAFFQLSTYLQSLQEVSPIQASLTLLPYTLSLFVFAILAGGWVGKRSNQLLIGGGLALMTLGLAAMAVLLNPAAGFWVYLVPLVLLGGGQSIANIPRMSAVLATAPPELAGAASATNNASMQLGSALGIAVLGALFQGFARTAYTSDLTALGFNAADIEKSVKVLRAWLEANSGDVASQFGITVQQLQGVISNYQHAYTSGVALVLWVAAAVVAAGVVLAWFTFGKSKK